jgi:hypothetical protein
MDEQGRRRHRPEQPTAVVDDHDAHAVRRAPPDKPARQHPQKRGLAALGVSEADQVWIGGRAVEMR